MVTGPTGTRRIQVLSRNGARSDLNKNSPCVQICLAVSQPADAPVSRCGPTPGPPSGAAFRLPSLLPRSGRRYTAASQPAAIRAPRVGRSASRNCRGRGAGEPGRAGVPATGRGRTGYRWPPGGGCGGTAGAAQAELRRGTVDPAGRQHAGDGRDRGAAGVPGGQPGSFSAMNSATSRSAASTATYTYPRCGLCSTGTPPPNCRHHQSQ